MSSGLELKSAIRTLQTIAPLHLAEPWDNVGLIIEPAHSARIRRVLLAIDFTEAVWREAMERRVGLVVAYHPPIFEPIKRIRPSDPRTRLVLQAFLSGVAVYSPHTALDAVPGGVNDWLADGLGRGRRRPLVPVPGHPRSRAGAGRRVALDRPVSLATLCRRLKRHLGTRTLRVARAGSGRIRTVAVCAGAGGSLLRGVAADAWITGEMRHHDLLAAREAGVTVILSEHTRTERGYLAVLRRTLRSRWGRRVDVDMARREAEVLDYR
jgi:dinuclear metal center YbgI/SA1388 family protein